MEYIILSNDWSLSIGTEQRKYNLLKRKQYKTLFLISLIPHTIVRKNKIPQFRLTTSFIMSTLHKRFVRKYPNGSKKENRTNMKQQEYQSMFLDPIDQSRAFYYLGLTYHFKAKELLRSTGGLLDNNIRTLLNKAIIYYE